MNLMIKRVFILSTMFLCIRVNAQDNRVNINQLSDQINLITNVLMKDSILQFHYIKELENEVVKIKDQRDSLVAKNKVFQNDLLIAETYKYKLEKALKRAVTAEKLLAETELKMDSLSNEMIGVGAKGFYENESRISKIATTDLENGFYVVMSSSKNVEGLIYDQRKFLAKTEDGLIVYVNEASGWSHILVNKTYSKHEIGNEVMKYRSNGIEDCWWISVNKF
jgi:hypothetical protein